MKNLPADRWSYAWGFLGSIMLTFLAYALTQRHLDTGHAWPPDAVLGPVLIAIALVQLAAQLVLFLHLGDEAKPRLRLMVAGFAGLVVLIVVVGSIWIMNNLNYHMGTPSAVDSSIIKDEGIHH